MLEVKRPQDHREIYKCRAPTDRLPGGGARKPGWGGSERSFHPQGRGQAAERQPPGAPHLLVGGVLGTSGARSGRGPCAWPA